MKAWCPQGKLEELEGAARDAQGMEDQLSYSTSQLEEATAQAVEVQARLSSSQAEVEQLKAEQEASVRSEAGLVDVLRAELAQQDSQVSSLGLSRGAAPGEAPGNYGLMPIIVEANSSRNIFVQF
jgi:peptidoglycan hydrolase CwlO-like protein